MQPYITNINKHSSREFEKYVTESEKYLIRSFKRIMISGKKDREVPVLFTEGMVKSVDLFLQLRKTFIEGKNNYLFAATNSPNSISGTHVVYKHVRLSGVKNPTALTSTRLRKHVATISQVINLSAQDQGSHL